MTVKKRERPIAPVPRNLLTREEAAVSLGMAVDTFEKYVQPHLRLVIVGRLILVPPKELERYVSANARPLTET